MEFSTLGSEVLTPPDWGLPASQGHVAASCLVQHTHPGEWNPSPGFPPPEAGCHHNVPRSTRANIFSGALEPCLPLSQLHPASELSLHPRTLCLGGSRIHLQKGAGLEAALATVDPSPAGDWWVRSSFLLLFSFLCFPRSRCLSSSERLHWLNGSGPFAFKTSFRERSPVNIPLHVSLLRAVGQGHLQAASWSPLQAVVGAHRQLGQKCRPTEKAAAAAAAARRGADTRRTRREAGGCLCILCSQNTRSSHL